MTTISEGLRTNRLLSALKEKLPSVKAAAENKRHAENVYKEVATDALSDLVAVDGLNGDGVRFEYGDKEYAAFVCQPEPERIWDSAPLVEWLKDNGFWDSVSVTVVDPEKLESEMAAGNIKRSDLDGFQIEKQRSAYVKFINPRPGSK